MPRFNRRGELQDEEEEARLQEALHEFQNAFEHDGSRGGKDALPKTFVRGDVVNAEKGTGSPQLLFCQLDCLCHPP